MPPTDDAPAPLSPERLCWHCSIEGWRFETTDELEDLDRVIGQDRALEAMQFAVGIDQPGFNLFALGPESLGKHRIVEALLRDRAGGEEAGQDWCYVYNFASPHRPRGLALPAGRGRAFRNDMAQMVRDLRDVLVGAFEGDDYRTRRQVIEEELKERQQAALTEIEADAQQRGLSLVRTPMGFSFAPTHDGQLLTPEVFATLEEAERKRIEGDMEVLQKELQTALRQTPLWIKQTREKVKALNQEVAELSTSQLIAPLNEAYADLPAILDHLTQVQTDVVENVDAFLQQEPNLPAPAQQEASAPLAPPGHAMLSRYSVNLVVDDDGSGHAPVIYEDNPTYERLCGMIEHRAEMGTLTTDFTMIRPGALHQANGGYLVIDARKILSKPMAWEALKRALIAREIRTEPALQGLGMPSTTSLAPQPIPLSLKVVLLGEQDLYYMLSGMDPEFRTLFKVLAEFDEQVARDNGHDLLYARFVATLARRNGLRPFEKSAVARVLEQAARLTGDTERLTTRSSDIADLLREADFHAGAAGAERVDRAAVDHAIDRQRHRLSRLSQRMQEQVERGTILIATDGSRVGQINGLSVLSLGGFAFGKASRISARVSLGRGDVIDIEREVELGGPLHTKGVLILRAYLAAHFAPEIPLSLSASLVFEQSYGGVDGDSASSTELYALLSSLSGVPIRQGLAVTGSVNQFGEVQAIGGVNEKVEGFFDLCAARGLTGEQGVLIPEANVKHLMLRPDVVSAVQEGRFAVYPVRSIDEGITLLTGQAAGARTEAGDFPPGSINALVRERLIDLARQRREFDSGDRASGADEGAGA